MKLVRPIFVACAAATLVVGGLAVSGRAQMDDDAATTKPAAEAAPAPAAKPKSTRSLRLVQPWSKVNNLTDEQRQQLFDIHEDHKAKLKALEAEEEEKCNAVLTEEQRAQLAETLDADKAAAKVKAAERRQAAKEEKKAAPAD